MFELPTVHLETETKDPNDTLGPDGLPLDGGMPKGPIPGVLSDDPRETPRANGTGTCRSATCISFVTVGYCAVVIALAVAYKKWKPVDRSKQFDREVGADDDAGFNDDETEILNPDFVQHRALHSSGMSVASRGTSFA